MSTAIKQFIIMLVLAGIVLTPACSHVKNKDSETVNIRISATPSPSGSKESGYDKTTEMPKTSASPGSSVNLKPDSNSNTEGKKDEGIKVITSEEELEEYFNSISDEEIEELFNAIENIDITGEIKPETDPGFDEVIIPD